MHSAGKLLAIVVGGFALGACGSSNSGSTPVFDGGTDPLGADAGNGTGSGSGSSGGSSSGSSSSGSSSGSSSSGSGSSSGGSPSDGGVAVGTAGYAIPLTAPEGEDDEYTLQATVGSQTFTLDIDTGSTTAGIAGSGCSACTGLSPLYAPSASAKSTGQTAKTSYEDGSGWSGSIYSDTVSLGHGTPTVSIDLVDITTENKFFDGTNDEQGILGLGPQGNAEPNTTGFLPLEMASLTDTFAFQFCDTDGTMWLGGDGAPTGAVVYTPLLAITGANQYYSMNVNAMSLGSAPIVTNASATFAQPVLDTGTSLFYVPTTVYTAFQTALEASAGFKTVFGTSTIATTGKDSGCVTATSATDAQVDSTLPPITLSLPNMTSGAADVTISATALNTYLYSQGGGQYCLAIQDGGTPDQDPSTFGDAFMQAFVSIVDIQGARIGFAPSACTNPQIRRTRHPAKTGPHRAPRPGFRR